MTYNLRKELEKYSVQNENHIFVRVIRLDSTLGRIEQARRELIAKLCRNSCDDYDVNCDKCDIVNEVLGNIDNLLIDE